MKAALKFDVQSKTLCSSKTPMRLKEEDIRYVDLKFYQKLFVVFISLSTILIFPESPKELENICENYYSRNHCNVW